MASADSASNVLRGTSRNHATLRSASWVADSRSLESGARRAKPICICVRSTNLRATDDAVD